jgi:hypothetical protein
MRESVLSLRLATHRAPPPSAIRSGVSPTPIVLVTSGDRGSAASR